MTEPSEYRRIHGKTYLHLYRNKWLCVDKQTLESRYHRDELDWHGQALPKDRTEHYPILVK